MTTLAIMTPNLDVISQHYLAKAMNRENQLLVIDEPLEFKN